MIGDSLREKYRQLAKRCGTWSIARKMAKEGWSLETALEVLVGRRLLP